MQKPMDIKKEENLLLINFDINFKYIKYIKYRLFVFYF